MKKYGMFNSPLVLIMALLLVGFGTYLVDASFGLQIIIASFLGLFFVVGGGVKNIMILLPIDMLVSFFAAVFLTSNLNNIQSYIMTWPFIAGFFLNIVIFLMVFSFAVMSGSKNSARKENKLLA